jgi:protein-disulfide isomerase
MKFVLPRLLRSALPAGLLLVGLGACGGDGARAETAGAGSDALSAAPAANAESHDSDVAPADTIDLRRIGFGDGSEDAPVTVIEFSDFGCPFCAMFYTGTYPQLHAEFVRTGRVRWIFVPFVMGTFPNGAEAARAAQCAAEQDRFPEMKARIYAGQREWKASRDPARLFGEFADEVGLDRRRFASCFAEDRRGAFTHTNNRAADALGVRATPSFLVNGRLVEGALPLEQFRMILGRLSEGAE